MQKQKKCETWIEEKNGKSWKNIRKNKKIKNKMEKEKTRKQKKIVRNISKKRTEKLEKYS